MLRRRWISIRWDGTRSLVLHAGQFPQFLRGQSQADIIHSAFQGNPLASLSTAVRGDILARIARNLQAGSAGGKQIEDPILSLCPSGRRRSICQAEYDWLCDGRRTECKSSMISWSPSGQRWRFHFAGVKLAAVLSKRCALFDDLFIVLLTPQSLHVYLHDLSVGMSSAGFGTDCVGHGIFLNGPRHERCWERSSHAILAKINSTTNGCQHLATLPMTHDDVQAALRTRAESDAHKLMDEAYRSVPMQGFVPMARSLQIRSIARSVDELLNAGAAFDDPEQVKCINGAPRNRHQMMYHWFRNGLRVKCKSAQLAWVAHSRFWRAHFRKIHGSTSSPGVPAFDDLLLVLYTPRGLHIYRHGLSGLLAKGSVTFGGPAGEHNWSLALDAILVKLASSCEFLALVEW